MPAGAMPRHRSSPAGGRSGLVVALAYGKVGAISRAGWPQHRHMPNPVGWAGYGAVHQETFTTLQRDSGIRPTNCGPALISKAGDYSIRVLGLIFLKFANSRFSALEGELKSKVTGRREIGTTDYQARRVLNLPENARFNQTAERPRRG